MDATEIHLRLAQMALDQLRHEVGLRHSDLQRRFILGLTLGASLIVSLVRAEPPGWAMGAAAVPFGWAAWEMRQIRDLAQAAARQARAVMEPLQRLQEPQDSHVGEENQG